MICIPGCRKEAGNDSQKRQKLRDNGTFGCAAHKGGSVNFDVGTSPAFYNGNIGKSVNVKPLKLGCWGTANNTTICSALHFCPIGKDSTWKKHVHSILAKRYKRKSRKKPKKHRKSHIKHKPHTHHTPNTHTLQMRGRTLDAQP